MQITSCKRWWRILIVVAPYLQLISCRGLPGNDTSPAPRRGSGRPGRTSRGYAGAMNVCPPCDVRRCSMISPELCDGQIVKDECNCCPVCDREEGLFIRIPPRPSNSSACAEVTCSRSEECIINIQGLPMCRCLTAYWCRRELRSRPLCSEKGVTFKSRCFVKIHECSTGLKEKIAHKGSCRIRNSESEFEGGSSLSSSPNPRVNAAVEGQSVAIVSQDRRLAREERRKLRKQQKKRAQRQEERQARLARRVITTFDPLPRTTTVSEVTQTPHITEANRASRKVIKRLKKQRKREKDRRMKRRLRKS